MSEFDSGSNSVFSVQLHIVWVTKHRKKLLMGETSLKLRETIREICDSEAVQIIDGHIAKDYVHILVSVPPKISMNKFILLLKGKTTYNLLTAFDELRQEYRGRHLWAKGCFCCSSGQVTDETIQRFVEDQGEEEPPAPSPQSSPW
ncbi:MAG: IS200/IS605 family transposase [Deltaproteobacteria bacterium]|jgi:putative transposase|nr:IS200/IS605 family transposase [Deltaproteobacteria bacterium]